MSVRAHRDIWRTGSFLDDFRGLKWRTIDKSTPPETTDLLTRIQALEKRVAALE
jgi:hypothetical protein